MVSNNFVIVWLFRGVERGRRRKKIFFLEFFVNGFGVNDIFCLLFVSNNEKILGCL